MRFSFPCTNSSSQCFTVVRTNACPDLRTDEGADAESFKLTIVNTNGATDSPSRVVGGIARILCFYCGEVFMVHED